MGAGYAGIGGEEMKIREEILKILDACEIKGNIVFLPQMQLERKIYLEVNKHLENLGGKWNRKAKGHVFDSVPADSFENMLLTGETTDFKKEFQFFETPLGLVDQMVKMAEIKRGDWVLEPSAGHGAILDYLRECKINSPMRADEFFIKSIEINKENCKVLRLKDHFPLQIDFLSYKERQFNRIIMNPPFTKQQDIDHVLHAWSLLARGGILVSIVSEAPFFRENKKSIAFREFLNNANAEIIKNPEGTFKASGTMVNTRIIKVRKQKDA